MCNKMKQKKLQKLMWKEASSFLVLTEKIIIIVHCLKFASSPEKILHSMLSSIWYNRNAEEKRPH